MARNGGNFDRNRHYKRTFWIAFCDTSSLTRLPLTFLLGGYLHYAGNLSLLFHFCSLLVFENLDLGFNIQRREAWPSSVSTALKRPQHRIQDPAPSVPRSIMSGSHSISVTTPASIVVVLPRFLLRVLAPIARPNITFTSDQLPQIGGSNILRRKP